LVVDAVHREPVSAANSAPTGKNTGKIHQNGFIGPLLKPEARYFRAFFAFAKFQITGNIIFNNREKAENNRERWARDKGTSGAKRGWFS
jgi:hypothetical protein